jgi:MSHA biogenesis protein MshQ
LQDTDGVAVGNVNGVSAINPVHFGTASTGAGISFTGGYNLQKWGRLAMSNVDGSELTTLIVPIFVEYYNGTAFVSNSNDNCTAISLANQISLSNPSTASGAAQAGTATMTVGAATASASLSPATLASGASSISFSSPGAGNTGYININSNISSLLPWLLYTWNQGGTANTSPSAVATFGVYQGNPNIIYFREIY